MNLFDSTSEVSSQCLPSSLLSLPCTEPQAWPFHFLLSPCKCLLNSPVSCSHTARRISNGVLSLPKVPLRGGCCSQEKPQHAGLAPRTLCLPSLLPHTPHKAWLFASALPSACEIPPATCCTCHHPILAQGFPNTVWPLLQHSTGFVSATVFPNPE